MAHTPKYLCFLAPDDNSNRYYVLDSSGNTVPQSFFNGNIKPLGINPGGLEQMVLSFIRNVELDGVNRIFSTSLTFIADSLQIIENLFYSTTGIGMETRIRLLIFEYNAQPQPGEANYQKYHEGYLDLFKYRNKRMGKGFTCGLLDGGFMQAYNAFAHTTLVIPCDGSIAQNRRILFDGMLVGDVFNYQFLATTNPYNNLYSTVASQFQNNEGDNYNVVHNDPGQAAYSLSSGNPIPTPWLNSPNFLFYAEQTISVRVTGSIVIRPFFGSKSKEYINMFLATDASVIENVTETTGDITRTASLIPNIAGNNTVQVYTEAPNSYATLTNETTYNFDQTIVLQAGEKLYMMMMQATDADNQLVIVSGGFQLTFSSSATPTRCWGITLYDAMAYLVAEMNTIIKAVGGTQLFTFKSPLLQNLTNLVLTSGAAVQASGNPDYGKYYRVFDINTVPGSNLITAYGPVIKISFADLYKICKLYGFGALKVTGNVVEFVPKGSVWDSSNPTPYSIGEVANCEDSLAEDYFFTGVKIGAKAVAFDQKTGKYDWNTTAEYISTLISAPLKYLDLTAPVTTSAYAIEKWRAGILEVTTSITNNDNDDTVVLVNVDTSQTAPDIEQITFTSLVPNPNLSTNSNIVLRSNLPMQQIPASNVNGSYLSLRNDPSIFVFCEPNLNAVKNITVEYAGQLLGELANALTGLPADYVQIDIWLNGAIVNTKRFTIGDAGTIGPTLNFSNSYSVALNCLPGSCIYMRMSTSLNAGGEIDTCSINVLDADNVTAYWEASGSDVPISPGVPAVLIALPSISAPLINNYPVLSSSFQYFIFNSILAVSDFSYLYTISQYAQGPSNQNLIYSLFKNGAVINTQTIAGTSTQSIATQTSNLPSDALIIGDLFFILASPGANMNNVQVTNLLLQFTATNVECNPPLRVPYDILTGIPPYVFDASGNPVWNTAGCPYNIEGMTWARLMTLWKSWIAGPLFDQANGIMQFVKADKNENLYTSYQGVVYKENTDFRKTALGAPMVIPRLFEMDTEVEIRFPELYDSVVNQMVEFLVCGVPFYGFPLSMQQSPTFNAKQKWQFLWAPINDKSQLISLNFDGIKYLEMTPNSIRINALSPVQFVAENRVLAPGCHFFTVDKGLFREQLYKWFQKADYCQPWQIGDTIELQNFVYGLSPVTAYIYDAVTGAELQQTAFTDTPVNALPSIINNWQASVPTAGLPPCKFYIVVNAGGPDGANIISEIMELCADQPATILFNYGSTYNTQGVPFSTGYSPYIRLYGNITGNITPQLKAEFFVDDEQDSTLLGAIAYEKLLLSLEQMPPYMIRRVNRFFSLNYWTAEDTQYTYADQKADWQRKYDTDGQPMNGWEVEVQEANISDGYDVTASGISEPVTLAASFDVNMFGNNYDNDGEDPDPTVQEFTVEFP